MTEQPAHLDNQPLNELEEQLARGEQPDANPVDVILAFLNNEVYVVSSDALEGPDSQVEPLVLANSSGKPVLAVFSHPSRVTEQYLAAAPNVLGTQGAAIIGNLGEELGMVINPGAAYGFEIDPEGVANIRRDFKPTDESADGTAAAPQPTAQPSDLAADRPAQDRDPA
ncbi:SseB protein N-terminal domain-containing protein [Arthrobacter sp. ov407]|uniref:SseB family protein n=1 Tax=Arthrobacter sp. ov407 TaxID=1761748 RepID=UPI00087FB7AD|nr:SseB family protein [Arthrobacter sp. ov407]SDK42145.1 SseB protein N-terminal domain-containing protein [Arthrobacter sp. ov407]